MRVYCTLTRVGPIVLGYAKVYCTLTRVGPIVLGYVRVYCTLTRVGPIVLVCEGLLYVNKGRSHRARICEGLVYCMLTRVGPIVLGYVRSTVR